MNTIRKLMEIEGDKIKNALDNAYRAIRRYQNNRSDKACEDKMREAILEAAGFLSCFKPHIPVYKQRYFDIIISHNELALSARDLIMTFDRAVYELHTRLEKNLLGAEDSKAWSPLMKEILDGRRVIPDNATVAKDSVCSEFLASGISVVNGFVDSKVAIYRSEADLHLIKHGDILVSKMTTPDIIQVIEKISGIATEQGGQFCHAAVIAREFNIPCIVGCGPFSASLKNGDEVTLDAYTGIMLTKQI